MRTVAQGQLYLCRLQSGLHTSTESAGHRSATRCTRRIRLVIRVLVDAKSGRLPISSSSDTQDDRQNDIETHPSLHGICVALGKRVEEVRGCVAAQDGDNGAAAPSLYNKLASIALCDGVTVTAGKSRISTCEPRGDRLASRAIWSSRMPEGEPIPAAADRLTPDMFQEIPASDGRVRTITSHFNMKQSSLRSSADLL